jgi:lipopolysaccharide transport protein LptA
MHSRSVRITRRLLIGIIILVLSAVFINYAQTWYRRMRLVKNAYEILGSDLARSAVGIKYQENDKGVPRFEIRAQLLLDTRQGKSILQGIKACDFNPDGSIHNEIHSQKAEYDREHKIADFFGDVRVFFGKGVELRMNSLHYDINKKTGHTDDKLQFISGESTGSARGVTFDQIQQSLDLHSEVDFVLAVAKPNPDGSAEHQKFHVTSNNAYCAEGMTRIILKGNARMESKSEVISGETIEAVLSSDRKQLTSLIASGNSAYRSGDPGEIQLLSGDRMEFIIGASKALEKIGVAGHAAFSSASPSGEQTLRGGEIDMLFDAAAGLPTQVQSRNSVVFTRKQNGEQMQMSGEQLLAAFVSGTKNLESIHVWKQAAMSADGGANSMRNELQADDIWMRFREVEGRTVLKKLDAEGSARWSSRPPQARSSAFQEPARTLTASSLEMIYSAKGDSFESGSAKGKVVVTESRNETEARLQMRRLSADHTQFYFFPGNNQLREMNADGHVVINYEKKGKSGAKALVEEASAESQWMKAIFALRAEKSEVESMAQWGGFSYKDASMKANSGRCDYDARKEMLVLRESPSISDDLNTTTGERIEYDKNRRILAVHGKVRSILNTSKSKGSFFTSSQTSSSSSHAIVFADEMQYWTAEEHARYTGKVQMLSESGQLDAASLDIVQGGERVDAQNVLRHYIPGKASSETVGRADKKSETRDSSNKAMVIRSSSLKYLKEKNILYYAGNVTANSGDLALSSDNLDVVPAAQGGGIDHAIARGKVHMQQGGKEGKGETAEYFTDPRKLVLIGNPAEILDPEKGKASGGQLTYLITDDRILLGNR